jgi:molybdenum-dependent DNA-binding transcriptional regulator ModE
MAGPRGSKYYDIFLKQQLELVTKDDDLIINEEGFRLLVEVRKEQSIVAAARNLNISYRKAWGSGIPACRKTQGRKIRRQNRPYRGRT